MARLLEVGYRMGLMPSAGEGYRNEWASLVAAAGSSGGFEAKFGEDFRQRNVETWLFFDRENPSSVISCIETARQNGRAVQDGAHHRDVGRAERRLPRPPRAGAAAAVGGALAAALRLDQAAGVAAARGHRGDPPAERRLRLPEPRLLPGARRQHVAASRREVLRAAADDRHGGWVDRHLPVDDAAPGALVLPGVPLVLRRRVQPAEDRALPDPEPRLPAVAAALPGEGRASISGGWRRPMAAGRTRTSGCTAC